MANFKEKVKDAKEIEKACAKIKDKVQKNSSKSNRGNSKYPPANYRWVINKNVGNSDSRRESPKIRRRIHPR